MRATETVHCELIDAALLLDGLTGELSEAALLGVRPEHLLFDAEEMLGPAALPEERAADAWLTPAYGDRY